MQNARWIVPVLALVCSLCGGLTAPPERPNIVYIVADDLGWKDVGFHGSDIKTPHLDGLAATGAEFKQLYAQFMCTPSRAAIMTGRYPMRYGLQTMVIASNHTYGLPTDEWLLPQALKEAGYQTAIVGKWHLGHADPKYWPRQRGFDSQYGPLIGEIEYFTHEAHGVTDWYRDNKVLKEEGYSTTLIGNEAVKVIDQHAKDAPSTPLFLYLTFNAPHSPYEAPKEYLDRYPQIQDPTRRAYAAMVTAMDEQIGRVVAALDKTGMRKNTIIVFQSDNGGTRNAMFAGEIDASKLKIPCDNGPYREGKGTLYEGGSRVCGLVNWPGHIKPGTTIDGMVHVVDMYPTLAGLAGASLAKCKPQDGVDMWPTFTGAAPSPRHEVLYNLEPYRAGIRKDNWKLVWRTLLPAKVELFDLSTDPGEQKNLAAEHPEIVAALQARLQELSTAAAPPLFLQTEFDALRKRLSLPPSLPQEELIFEDGD